MGVMPAELAAVAPELVLLELPPEPQAAMSVAAATAATAVMAAREGPVPGRLRNLMEPSRSALSGRGAHQCNRWMETREYRVARKIDRMSSRVNGQKTGRRQPISNRYVQCGRIYVRVSGGARPEPQALHAAVHGQGHAGGGAGA